MKSFKIFMCIMASVLVMAVRVTAQTADNNLEIAINKTTGAIEIINKTLHTSTTQQYQIQVADLDIYDAKGQYAGSLHLEAGKITVSELNAGETLKAAKLQLVEVATGKVLEYKDLAIALK